jgi:hypothetical protein
VEGYDFREKGREDEGRSLSSLPHHNNHQHSLSSWEGARHQSNIALRHLHNEARNDRRRAPEGSTWAFEEADDRRPTICSECFRKVLWPTSLFDSGPIMEMGGFSGRGLGRG